MSKLNFGLRASILNNTNKLYSSSFCNWAGVKEGAFFQFKNDEIALKILNRKIENYSKTCQIKNKNLITVNFNFNPVLFKDDLISIVYKEKRISKLLFILNPGSGYRIGDMVFCLGGTINPNYQSEGSFKVISVGENGCILDLELIEGGKYIKPPENKEIKTYSDGPGTGSELAVLFEDCGTIEDIERKIVNIFFNQDETQIYLDKPLPDNLSNIEIKFSKWVAIIDSNYIIRQGNVIGEPYEINNDFIGSSKLIKINKNDPNVDQKINLNFENINNKFNEIEQLIKTLQKNV